MEKLVPLPYFKSGTRIEAETNVGTSMASPENVSPPPNHSVSMLDDGTMMKRDLVFWEKLDTIPTELVEQTKLPA